MVHWFPWRDRDSRCGRRISAKVQPPTRDPKTITCLRCAELYGQWRRESIEIKPAIAERVYLRIHGK